MKTSENVMNVFPISDNPGDYNEILTKSYDILIENNSHFSSCIEIVIPTFQRFSLLRESLKSALDQDTTDTFLITIIDNDPKTSIESLKDLNIFKDRIRYIRNRENLGMFGNWNRALQVSIAPFVVLLHDDDLLEPFYISKVTEILKIYKDVGVITHTPYQLMSNKKENPYSSLKMRLRKGLITEVDWKDYLFGNVTSASAMLINKQKGIEIGGWKSTEYPSADYFFNARMAYRFQVLRYYMPISVYRSEVNTSLQEDIQKKFLVADTWFILCSLNSHLKISKILKVLAEVAAIRRIEEIENLEGGSVPGSEELVSKYRELNRLFYIVLLVFKRLYIKSRSFIYTKGYRRLS